MSFTRMVEWSSARHAAREAFVFEGVARTYGEVETRARRLANGLRELGVEKGDRVVTMCGNRPEYFEAEMAVAKLGAVRVPGLVTLPAPEVKRLIEVTEPRAIIATPEAVGATRSAAQSFDIPVVVSERPEPGETAFEDMIEGSSDAPLNVDISEDDLYAIRFTGGTTGAPKAVVMDHRGMIATMTGLMLECPVDSSDVGLHVHPLSHASGFWGYMYWLRGAKNVILPAFGVDPGEVLRTIEAHRITSTYLIPATIYRLLDHPDLAVTDVSSLRTIFYGAMPMSSARLARALEVFGPAFIQTYGLSEAPVLVALLSREDHQSGGEERLRSVGRPVMSVDLRIVDDSGISVPPGVTGEIVVRSPSAMRGYWRNEELTQTRKRDGWIHTGDMARLDEHGYLYLADRKEDMMITGGFNVFPSEIEEYIYRHPGVQEAVVFGVADETWGDRVTAIVVPRPGTRLTEDEVTGYLADHLAKYKVPKRVVIRAEPLPKSAIGKILRREARAQLSRSSATGNSE